MKTDKNTVIGFVLLGILFFGFFWFNNKQNNATMAEKKRQDDSIAKVKEANITPAMKEQAKADSLRMDSTNKLAKGGNFGKEAAIGKEETVTIENEVMKVTFSNKGGRVKFVALKNYKSYDSTLVTLGSDNDKLGYTINSGNTPAQTNELLFTTSAILKNTDGSQVITYSLRDSTGKSIEHVYTIKPNEFMVNWMVNLNGADQLLTNGAMNINWHIETMQHERNAKYERAQMSNICFVEDNEFDYISQKTEHQFEKPTQWVGAVQQFFNTTLIAKNNFNTGKVSWARHLVDTSRLLATVDANFQIKVAAGSKASIPFQMYLGPNDFNVLKKQAPEMDRIVNLGRDMYSFVRPINKYVIMPVFNFFSSFIKNFGWVILLLTLFIRLFTAPLTYGSYLNGAKMKILRPELDELKKKYKDDQQAFAMAQMKFNKEAGVNMLGGCIPALLQIPIFFALYSFFNSNIALRGQEFLWSKDLSAYDTFFHWHTELWAIGNHVSLFTITAVITSFFISIYNMSMTPTQDNPALKYMPYIFPFILFFVFNGLPSALTWYYTVSNLITLGLQFVIQNYIINHDKIIAGIEQKRKAPKKGPSKWQERLQQVQESQKKIQDMKNRSGQNKK